MIGFGSAAGYLGPRVRCRDRSGEDDLEAFVDR